MITLDAIENPVMVAGVGQLPVQAANGVGISAASVSGALVPPVAIELVVVATSATIPASQMLTKTWLLSAAAVVKIRNRVELGLNVAAGTQVEACLTAYCVTPNWGEAMSDIEGDSSDEDDGIGFTVRLAASNTVSWGIMQESVGVRFPTFGSGQGEAVT